MARQLRIQYEDTLYHIISRGNERMMIFLEDAGRIKYLNILHKTIERFNWMCHVYCLMGNHYHLMIETPDANLAKGMKYLESILKRYGPFNSMKNINNTQLGFGQPSLDEIFNEGEISKAARNLAILKAYGEHKYPLKNIANYLNMDPNYLCNILKKLE